MAVGFFSFSKFLLWRDLDAAVWPELAPLLQNKLISAILGKIEADFDPLFADDARLDELLDPKDLPYVLDVDASQTKVIEESRANRNFVVWGPPGTGKSQTIGNMIATAAIAGKKVLFVAEKMAALEVVHRRLTQAGLRDLCLELHSRSANKSVVLGELKRTVEAPRAKPPDLTDIDRLRAHRDNLNGEVALLNTEYGSSGRSPFQAMGAITRLRADGVDLPDFEAPAAAGWSVRERAQAEEAVDRLAALTGKFGPSRAHVWCGVQSTEIDVLDLQRLGAKFGECAAMLDDAAPLFETIERLLPATTHARTLEALARCSAAVAILAGAPEKSASALGSSALRENLTRAKSLVDLIEANQITRRRLDPRITPAAWNVTLTEARTDLAGRGASLFSFFDRRVRAANSLLRSVLREKAPSSLPDRLALLDAIIEAQKLSRQLDGETAYLEAAFATLWQGGEASDVGEMRSALAWVQRALEANVPELFQQVADPAAVVRARGNAAGLRLSSDSLQALVAQLFGQLNLDASVAFGCPVGEADIAEVATRLRSWIARPEGLSEWARLSAAGREAQRVGAVTLAERLADGALPPSDASNLWRFAIAEAELKAARQDRPALRALSGEHRERTIEEFQRLEARRRELAIAEARARHSSDLPIGRLGAMGVLYAEFQKQRRLMPVRKLMQRAGPAIQAIKPVFLMSPLSVAQFLPPGELAFDIVIIDEASQVRPEDALGAIARAKQVIVVGDDKQLPPTSFFDRQVHDDIDADEEDGEEQAEPTGHVRPKDMESILALCKASLPERVLRTHYRSRHPSLIEVSNDLFYDRKLYLAPSPDRDRVERGMRFHRVDGLYEPGAAKRCNTIEAEHVAAAVIEHARRWVGGQAGLQATLMVAAFSVSQRDAIWAAVDKARAQNLDCEAFFNHNPAEPFDVKNLENVQGDERDVVFVSVGYGPFAIGGKPGNQFGPVNKEGGGRRLNVLFTRARERTEVFCSFDPDAMDASKAGPGPAVLRRYLRMAKLGIADEPTLTGREADSDFEIAVAGSLRRMGFDVVHQVGSSGFVVDLAVVDPENASRFAIGVECDGASYHSAAWARERDRLRQSILEANGWRLHRVWSTDWFNDRAKAEARLEAAVREAIASRTAPAPVTGDRRIPQVDAVIAADEIVMTAGQDVAEPYVVARFRISHWGEPHEASRSELIPIVEKIVSIEGPIHRDEVARRVADLWGKARTGNRIQSAALGALAECQRTGSLRSEEGFWSLSAADQRPRPRSRAALESMTLKKAEYLPPCELESAVLALVSAHAGMTLGDLLSAAPRMLGFERTGASLRNAVSDAVRRLTESGLLIRTGEHFVAAKAG